MKQVIFKCKVDGRTVKGSWLCSKRPMRAQTIIERFVSGKVTNLMFVVKEMKGKMIKEE